MASSLLAGGSALPCETCRHMWHAVAVFIRTGAVVPPQKRGAGVCARRQKSRYGFGLMDQVYNSAVVRGTYMPGYCTTREDAAVITWTGGKRRNADREHPGRSPRSRQVILFTGLHHFYTHLSMRHFVYNSCSRRSVGV